MLLKYALGLDISSKKINCSLSVIDTLQVVKVKASTVIANSLSGFNSLLEWLKKHQKDTTIPLVINMEATGIYYESCALFLHQQGFSVSVVLPNKAKKYMSSIGLKSKNDSIDAKGLAQMAAEQSLKLWQPLGGFFYKLRQMTRQHQSLQEQKTNVRNQLHALEFGMYRNEMVEKQLSDLIQFIDTQIETLEVVVKTHLDSDATISKKVNNICVMKGLGTTTVATILAETNGFILFENNKQVVSYAGYDIIENESGGHTGKTKISKQGNSRIRRALFMPALSVVRWKVKPFINLYERTIAMHHIKMKSYVAVQKKLLTTIYALYKSGEEFTEGYVPKKNSPGNAETTQGKHLNVSSQLVQS
jgi:transposase